MKTVKTILKSFCISFSLYSKIPMPQFPWKDEDMKYVLCFFPWVGAVIGLCIFGWSRLCQYFSVGRIGYVMIGAAIPLLLTGGFHLDGYMDTMDAFHSYQDKEGKLRILKDSHIGAFSVIMVVLYYLLYIGAFSEIREEKALLCFCVGFFLARALSGISVVCFRPAKEQGILNSCANGAEKKVVVAALLLQLLLGAGAVLFISLKAGILVLFAVAAVFGYYRYRSYKELGGTTGDLAGWFVTICELAVAIAAAIGGRL